MKAASFEAKIVDPAELSRRLAALPRPLVFTNGVFDLLHRGHVTYLARARALGTLSSNHLSLRPLKYVASGKPVRARKRF